MKLTTWSDCFSKVGALNYFEPKTNAKNLPPANVNIFLVLMAEKSSKVNSFKCAENEKGFDQEELEEMVFYSTWEYRRQTRLWISLDPKHCAICVWKGVLSTLKGSCFIWARNVTFAKSTFKWRPFRLIILRAKWIFGNLPTLCLSTRALWRPLFIRFFPLPLYTGCDQRFVSTAEASRNGTFFAPRFRNFTSQKIENHLNELTANGENKNDDFGLGEPLPPKTTSPSQPPLQQCLLSFEAQQHERVVISFDHFHLRSLPPEWEMRKLMQSKFKNHSKFFSKWKQDAIENLSTFLPTFETTNRNCIRVFCPDAFVASICRGHVCRVINDLSWPSTLKGHSFRVHRCFSDATSSSTNVRSQT